MTQQSHSGHIPRENHNSRRYMHPNMHCSTLYNSQDTEATKMSINRGRGKGDAAHRHHGVFVTKRNCSLQRTWIDLDCHTQ